MRTSSQLSRSLCVADPRAKVWTGAKVLGVGEVEQFNTEGLTIGVDYTPSLSRETQDDALKLFVDVLKAGGSDVKVTDDIQSERWVKVIWNACWYAIPFFPFGLPALCQR